MKKRNFKIFCFIIAVFMMLAAMTSTVIAIEEENQCYDTPPTHQYYQSGSTVRTVINYTWTVTKDPTYCSGSVLANVSEYRKCAYCPSEILAFNGTKLYSGRNHIFIQAGLPPQYCSWCGYNP